MVNAIGEKFNVERKKATTYLCIIGGLLTTIFTTSAGGFLLGITDQILNEVGLFLATILEAVIFSWFIGADKLLIILNEHSNLKVGKWWNIVIKYMLPVLLTFIWVNGVISTYDTFLWMICSGEHPKKEKIQIIKDL